MAYIQYLTQIHLDAGVVQRLRAECELVGMTKPLVVSDPGVRAAGVLDRALAALGGLPHAVFDRTPSNPT
jgi:4-hydroxybutyrate dehydrogenase